MVFRHRNRYLSAIKQVFKKAHGLNYMADNPALSLKASKEEENIPEPHTDEVVAALRVALQYGTLAKFAVLPPGAGFIQWGNSGSA